MRPDGVTLGARPVKGLKRLAEPVSALSRYAPLALVHTILHQSTSCCGFPWRVTNKPWTVFLACSQLVANWKINANKTPNVETMWLVYHQADEGMHRSAPGRQHLNNMSEQMFELCSQIIEIKSTGAWSFSSSRLSLRTMSRWLRYRERISYFSCGPWSDAGYYHAQSTKWFLPTPINIIINELRRSSALIIFLVLHTPVALAMRGWW